MKVTPERISRTLERIERAGERSEHSWHARGLRNRHETAVSRLDRRSSHLLPRRDAQRQLVIRLCDLVFGPLDLDPGGLRNHIGLAVDIKLRERRARIVEAGVR